MRPKGKNIKGLLDRWKWVATEHLDWDATAKARQVELDRLREARKIHDDDNGFVLIAPKKREHFSVVRVKKLKRAAREGPEVFAHGYHAPHPPKQGR